MRIAITVSKELDATDGAYRFVLLPIPRREFDASISLYEYSTYARLCKCESNAARTLRVERRTIGAHVEDTMSGYLELNILTSKRGESFKFYPLPSEIIFIFNDD